MWVAPRAKAARRLPLIYPPSHLRTIARALRSSISYQSHSKADSKPASVTQRQPKSQNPPTQSRTFTYHPAPPSPTLRMFLIMQVIPTLLPHTKRPHRKCKITPNKSVLRKLVELLQHSEGNILQTLHRKAVRTQNSAFHDARVVDLIIAQQRAQRRDFGGGGVGQRGRGL